MSKKFFLSSKLSENIATTPEGFLLCAGVPIARTGEMIYGPGESPINVGPDGRAIVTREAREVFRPETIASFEGKPFTIKHPEDFVNPSNWKILAKGSIHNVRRGSGETENDLIADILVTDADAIKLVQGGIREVSCGYEAEYIETGVGRGMQTNIIGNHLALVEQGRAGTSYAINDQQGAKMKNLGDKIRGIFAKAGDEAAKVVDDSSKETPAAKADDEKMPKWADALTTQVKDLMTTVASMGSPSIMGDEEKEDDKDKDKSKDGDMPPWADALVKSVADLAEKVGKMSGKADDADEDEEATDEESEESEDADEDDESEDDDFEESPASKSKDEASRIEILAPGLKAKGKGATRAALMKAYESKDNKAIIDRLAGGKAVDLKKASQKTIDHLFVGASEVIGLYRTKDFSKWKQVRDSQANDEGGSVGMTAEEINAKNEKHYQGAH